jgi:cytochrome c5
MYTGMLHTHTLVVGLFLLLYLVKTYLLVSNKEETLVSFTNKTKWPERIISVLFLATGIFLYLNSGNITWMVHLKLAFVFASIPLAIIGFKKRNKGLAVLSLVLLFGAYGLGEANKKQATKVVKPDIAANSSELDTGKALYTSYCEACHGENGDGQKSGAKNLRISVLDKAAKASLIKNGKGAMPAYSALSDAEVDALILYTDSFLEEAK